MINFFDCEELMCHVVGIDLDDADDMLEDRLYEQFGMEPSQFVDLMNILIPMIGQSITIGMEEPTEYKWFSVDLWNWLRKFLLKDKA